MADSEEEKRIRERGQENDTTILYDANGVVTWTVASGERHSEALTAEIQRVASKKGGESSKDSLYDDFCDPSEDYYKMESRGFCYDIAAEQIAKAKKNDPVNWRESEHTIRGVLLLLFTWNFAARKTKQLQAASIAQALKTCKDDLRALSDYTIISADDRAWPHVTSAFEAFNSPCGQTGAAKALSLLNPELFIMWDTKIRNRLNRHLIPGIRTGQAAQQYVDFLKGIQRIIRTYDIQAKLPQEAILAKKIDEYHYVRIVKNLSRST